MQDFTAKDFAVHFPDDDACLEWIKNHLWPDGIHCPVCNKITKHHKLAKKPVYECDNCRKQVSPLANTIFRKSPTPLHIWFDAIHEMSTTRSGFSAKALQRKHGVTYKTAWRMFRQIRMLLDENAGIFTDVVEIDETYYGGKRRGDNQGRPAEGLAQGSSDRYCSTAWQGQHQSCCQCKAIDRDATDCQECEAQYSYLHGRI